jgi:ADP-heptose:LPS heptosyltransferase
MEGMEKIAIENRKATVNINQDKILVNCNASNYMLARRYPAQEFISVIEYIHSERINSQFLFTGSNSEFEYVEKVVSALEAKGVMAINVAGKWSIREFYDELKSCQLFITCDSFPLHLAAYLGIPTLAIWGPTQPEQFGYQNRNDIISVSLKMSCAPCLLHLHSKPATACKGNISCLKNLKCNQIARQALSLLSVCPKTRSIKTLST